MGFKIAAFADEADNRLEGQIEAMLENDVQMLEIRGVDGENIDKISNDKARLIRKRLDDTGLSVWSLGSPYGKISIDDDFTPHLESFKHSLEIADILGAKHIRLFSFYNAKESGPVLERLASFIKAAEGTDIMLCHENEKGIYGDIAARCLEIHKALPQLRAVFDPANYIQCGQDVKEAWQLISPYVEYMHIKDALPDGTVVPSGHGIGELPYLISQYTGSVLTVEPHLSVFKGFDELETEQKTKHSYCYPDSRTAFRAAVSALKDILERKN